MPACGFTGDPGMSSVVAARVHCLPLTPRLQTLFRDSRNSHCHPLLPPVHHSAPRALCLPPASELRLYLALALHLLAAGLRTNAPFHEEALSGRSREMLGEELDSNYSGFCCQ